ncbi:MAG TPA: radical SAM protein [Syntrophales bacterium]|nr:radical SAM protein [Syntrophales bacterium]
MPTVMLTAKCVNSCPWCFARAKMAEYHSRGIAEMHFADFESVVKFYESSGLSRMILLGGEPLLHTRFMDILELLRSRSFSVHVSTTGICSKALLDQIAAMKFPDLTFGLNSTSHFHYPVPKRRRVEDFLRRVGHRVMLGYTITESDIDRGDCYPIVDRLMLIMKYSLRPLIQFQIAVPADGVSRYIPLNRYAELMDLLDVWFRVLLQNGVSYGIDCHSIPRCAMPVTAADSRKFRSTCDHFMVDIGPGLEAWPCFPLSKFKTDLLSFGNLFRLQTYFQEQVRAQGLSCQACCVTCVEKVERRCSGGCLGFHTLPGMCDGENPRRELRAIREQRVATGACSAE